MLCTYDIDYVGTRMNPRLVEECRVCTGDTVFTAHFSLRNSKQPLSNIPQAHCSEPRFVDKAVLGVEYNICSNCVFIDK